MMPIAQTRRVAPAGTDTTRNESGFLSQDSTFILPAARDLPGVRFTRMAEPGEHWRPATTRDVIIDRGEFWGDGVPRTAGGHPYEPLDWAWLWRQNRENGVVA